MMLYLRPWVLVFFGLLFGCASGSGSGGGYHGSGGHVGGHHGGGNGEEGYGHRMGKTAEWVEPLNGIEAAPAFSSSGHDDGKAMVIGTVSCELWSRSLADANEGRGVRLNGYKSWVYGYLSGLSSSTRLPLFENVEAASLTLFISDYCRAHPGDTTAVAAQHLAHALIERSTPKPKQPNPRKR